MSARDHEVDALVRAEAAEAAVARVRKLVDSYPPGSDFVTSGLADLFRLTLDPPADEHTGDRDA